MEAVTQPGALGADQPAKSRPSSNYTKVLLVMGPVRSHEFLRQPRTVMLGWRAGVWSRRRPFWGYRETNFPCQAAPFVL